VTRRWRPALVAVLVVGGLACVAQAGWIHAKALLAQAMIEYAFERARDGAEFSRPWPWADTRMVARLHLPGSGPALVVLSGPSGRNLAFGPAHDPASVAPGERGNSVIAGHRDTHFRPLALLQVGDPVRLERLDGVSVDFVVTAVDVVDSRRWDILLEADAPRLTLVTCYPFGAMDPSGPMRFVVTADLPGVFHEG
jgi:sortase A